ncbi:MAG: MATE family efflux transporter [Bacteroidales bacterium]|nr:MATE family efflux transporter [Lachnoclostridium sp.]MCM1383068.1 MATE family efflux transporter [Lachnoclostridium sp.]MCM1463877.1 MATE family efflux transporter [Bacteroidales bacterium]
MKNDLTQGNVLEKLIKFSLPYLFSCFLQTFYGLADLFITGQFNGADAITAVSVGSQVTHMLTVVIVGLAMGTTVNIGLAVGADNERKVSKVIGNTISLFAIFSVLLTLILLAANNKILYALSVPEESWIQAKNYLTVCFIGVPFITAYNVLSSIYRGMGDSRSPLYFIGIAGVFNIVFDYLLIGVFRLGALGAALATVAAQALSVAAALSALLMQQKKNRAFSVKMDDLRLSVPDVKGLLKVGAPIALQDGLIQVAFLIITVIANRRGLEAAAAVGIVEKLIGFMFLVPSAMLSAVSAVTAQNAGAGFHDRGKKALGCGILITVVTGMVFTISCQFFAETLIGFFVKDEPAVILMGGQYLRAYVPDCIFAGIHFCFSGYFCAYQKSMISFAHNLAAIILVRIPGAYYASKLFPDSLYPMGLAAPLGSVLSAVICVIFYIMLRKEFVKKVSN